MPYPSPLIRPAAILQLLLSSVWPRAGGVRAILPGVLAAAWWLAVAPAPALTITDPGQGVVDFTGDASELSGLAWLAGTTYHGVSDEAGSRKVYELNIALDSANGRVLAAAVTGSVVVAEGHDLEGIAFCRPRGEWWIADEGQYPAGGFLRAHALPDGKVLRTANLPTVMLDDRPNFGLESCAWGAGALWTANEEALAHESALSTAAAGSIVRLQRFDHRFEPSGQWAYETDSFGFDSTFTTLERSGVSDLLALPDGTLLVLERALGFGFVPSFRNRIYRVAFEGATEVGGIADLDGVSHTRVSKSLLWERNMGGVITRNFEGIALGPALPAIGPASYSLLLVADNGGDTRQHLYPLVLHGLVAPPPLERWRQCFWGVTAATGPAAEQADPDGDGLVNLLEYALGGDPLVATRAPMPQSGLEDGRLSLTFTRNIERTDLMLIVQAADDPGGPWTDLAQSEHGGEMTVLDPGASVMETGTGLTRVVTVRDSAPSAGPVPLRRFMRMKVAITGD